MPTPDVRNVSQIKAALLHPATTSHFLVSIPKPQGFTTDIMSKNGITYDQDKLNLLCSETSLPGSQLATLELTNTFHGVTERYAYRRLYDDRIDLTFYVDAENYLPIRFFETWMKLIANESVATQPTRGETGAKDSNYFYRFNYPDKYIVEGLTITKFEKSSAGVKSGGGKNAGSLTYTFVRSFPMNITSMPVSYEAPSLLKCTVSMNYLRYVLESPDKNPIPDNNDASSPIDYSSAFSNQSSVPDLFDPKNQAVLNGLQFQGVNSSLPNYNFNNTLSSSDIAKTYTYK